MSWANTWHNHIIKGFEGKIELMGELCKVLLKIKIVIKSLSSFLEDSDIPLHSLKSRSLFCMLLLEKQVALLLSEASC